MINHTITFAAITIFHLMFLTFTMDIYRTDPAIWSQTETTTDRKDCSSGTAYQQMAATDTPGSFNYVTSTFHNQLNVTIEKLVSLFNTSNYVGNCSDLQKQTDADELQYISYVGEFPHELLRTAWELYTEFNTIVETALWFICTRNTTEGLDVISMSRMYVHNCTEFIDRLNGSIAANGEMSVLDTVADLYRTCIQHVESVKELAEHLTEMISEDNKIDAMNRSILQKKEEMYFLNESSVWEIIFGEQEELVDLLKNCFERAVNMSEHIEGNPFIYVITAGTTSRFLDAQDWKQRLEQENKTLVKYQTNMQMEKLDEFVLYMVRPVLMAIVLVVGIAGNGLLLTIFVRHKGTRTLANSMLINLTVVDFVSLVVNLLLEYLRLTRPWPFGLLCCKLFFLFRYLLVAVSTYSVAVISVQRFVAVSRLTSLAWCHQSKKTKYVLIASVWGLGFILSVPHAVIAEMDKAFCFEYSRDKFGPVSSADLIDFCVVPLLIAAVFSGLTAYRIRRSVSRIPGEATGHEQLKHDRMVSSNVLVALTVLFVVSYTPDFLLKFLIIQIDINVSDWEFILINVTTYFLRFVNCCLNPVVLFVMSKRYRGYIKRYCGHRKVQPASKSDSSTETSL